jgi:glucokinase
VKIVIGVVDIGGTKTATGFVSMNSLLLSRRMEESTLPERGFEDLVGRIATQLQTSGGRGGDDGGEKLEGIAIGTTGPIDRETGVFGRVDSLPGFEGSNLREALSKRLGIDGANIVIENDADAAALGELVHGAGRGASRFLYVTISTGIGGGFVIDGKIYRGAGGAHPEIGHHVIEPTNGPRCSCGARGCWEVLASGPAMATTTHSTEMVCEAARGGEEWAKAVVDREGLYLGVGIANLVSMFAPDVIALGGGVMRSADLFLDRIHAIVKESCTLVPASTTKIVLASLGADAGLLGAAEAFHQQQRQTEEG